MAYDEVTAQLLRENEELRAAFADIESVRDRFAMAALPSVIQMIVDGKHEPTIDQLPLSSEDFIAVTTYRIADAVMKVRTAGVQATSAQRPVGIGTDLGWLMGLADQYAAMTGNAYSEAAHDPSKSAHMAHPERERLEAAMRVALGVAIPSTTDMQLRLVDAKNALQHAADAASPEVAGVYRQRAAELAEIVSVLAHGVDLPDGGQR